MATVEDEGEFAQHGRALFVGAEPHGKRETEVEHRPKRSLDSLPEPEIRKPPKATNGSYADLKVSRRQSAPINQRRDCFLNGVGADLMCESSRVRRRRDDLDDSYQLIQRHASKNRFDVRSALFRLREDSERAEERLRKIVGAPVELFQLGEWNSLRESRERISLAPFPLTPQHGTRKPIAVA